MLSLELIFFSCSPHPIIMKSFESAFKVTAELATSHFCHRDYCGPSHNHLSPAFLHLVPSLLFSTQHLQQPLNNQVTCLLRTLPSLLILLRAETKISASACQAQEVCWLCHQLCLLLLSLPTHPSTHVTLSSQFFLDLAGGT